MKLILVVNEKLDEQRRIVAYLDSFPLSRDLQQARLASHKGMISLRELRSQMQEELDALPTVERGFQALTTVRGPRQGAARGKL